MSHDLTPKAKMSFVPQMMTFGYVEVGQLSANQTATIVNTGNVPIIISEITATGDYAISHGDLPTLQPGDFYDIIVTFTPKAYGSAKGGIYVNAGFVGDDEHIELFGTGFTDYNNPHHISKKANASVVGVTASAQNLGAFTGSLVPDNANIKQALQLLILRCEYLNTRITNTIGNLDNRFDDFTGDLSDLSDILDDVNGLVIGLRDDALHQAALILAMGGDIQELTETLGTATANISTHAATLTNMLGSVASLSTTVSTLTSSVETTALTVNTLDTSFADLSMSVTALDNSVSLQASALSNAEYDLANLSTSVTTLGGHVNVAMSSVTTLSGTVSSLSSNVATLGGEVSLTMSSITSLSGTVASLTSTVSTLDGEITATMAVVDGLEGTVSSLNTTVTAQNATITTQQTAIANLGTKIGTKLDVNGKIIGWEANNDGTSGGLDFRVDYFRLWNAAGTTSKAPFEFRNGGVYIASLSVDELSIANNAVTPAKISTPSLSAISGTLGDLDIRPALGGTGRIRIFDTDDILRVTLGRLT